MFRPIIIDPVVFQVTLVVIGLLAISIWQKLKTTSGIVIAVYAIYMISFVSANTKVKTSQPMCKIYPQSKMYIRKFVSKTQIYEKTHYNW